MLPDVLIDSNVFIALIRHRGDPSIPLVQWAGSRNLLVCGMVRLEVLRGIRSAKARQALETFMDVMVNVPSDANLWNRALELAMDCDRKGFVVSNPDAVIAASALKAHAAVMTSDAHFSRIDGLQVISPPPEWFAP